MGTCSAKENELLLFKFERNDIQSKRLKLKEDISHESLLGISGAGVFIQEKNLLYGIISRYPNENFELKTIDLTRISFSTINQKLKSLNKVLLDTETSKHKRQIGGSIVDIHQAIINDVCIDLEIARLRLQTDMIDDWYHDSLKYIDLLSQDYLFKQFEKYFGNNNYVAREAEQFYVPKQELTNRQALVSPFIDRIMYMAVVGVLAEKLNKALIPEVYSARYNKFLKNQLIINGVEQWKKMQYALAEKVKIKDDSGNYVYNCIIKIDLLNFYDNIDQNLLIQKIKRVCETINEKKASDLLSEIIKTFTNKNHGLPQNSDASSLLATFYLNQVDTFMHNSTFAYFRFVDDIRIFCKNKYEARKILQNFESELRRCHLAVNSQKTKIFSIVDKDNLEGNEMHRKEFDNLFDLELSIISRFRNAHNYVYQNQAFHQSVELLKNNINEDLNSEKSARKLNFALNTIELLAKKNINIISKDSDFECVLLKAIESLIDRPWITTQVCKVLNVLSKESIKNSYLTVLKEILLDNKYNTYSFQTYQIWLLLAKHKCYSSDLIKFASGKIEKNDETMRPVIASMIIYLCSIDQHYRRVILRKFGEGFTRGYFQNRTTLISLRAFDTELINSKKIDPSLENAPEFTNRFKSKDLVYIPGYIEDNIGLDQLYSI